MNVIPQAQPYFDQREAKAVAGVINRGWITEGLQCAAFKDLLDERLFQAQGVFAPNGTLALVMGLLALGIGPGDEVLVPDLTFIASATACVLVGARPVFVDVTATNYQIDVQRLARKVTPKTCAIMPVHLYGMACDMAAVMAFAAAHDLMVIEDAAQAIGVTYNGRPCGTFGDVGCFSFYADKTITTGEGGYVVCRESDIYERLQYIRNQGRANRGSYTHPEIGYNFRITDLQGAVGSVQMDKLDEIIANKRAIYHWYQVGLAGVEQVQFLPVEPGSTFVPFRVALLCERATALTIHLDGDGITPRPFFTPLHRQPCFAYMGLDDKDYPNALDAHRRGLLLPVYPDLTWEQVMRICGSIRRFYG